MATPRARSLATWLGLMPLAALVAVTAWQPWLGFGLIIGVVGGALTLVALMRTLEWLDDRDRLPAAPLAVGAVVVSVAIVAVPAVLALLLLGRSSAIAAGGVSAVLVAGFFGRIELARQLDRRRMRQLDRALVAGGDLTAALAPLPPHYLFAVVTRLADHGRWAELLAYLAGNPGRHAAHPRRGHPLPRDLPARRRHALRRRPRRGSGVGRARRPAPARHRASGRSPRRPRAPRCSSVSRRRPAHAAREARAAVAPSC
jgi:hypothetical protein